MAASTTIRPLTLVHSRNFGEKSQGLRALTFAGRRRSSYFQSLTSTRIHSDGAAAAVPVAAAVSSAPGGNLSVLIPIRFDLVVEICPIYYFSLALTSADETSRERRAERFGGMGEREVERE